MALSAQTVTVYPLESYKIGQKEERPDKDATIAARFARMEAKYEVEGLRRSVEGVLLVHKHKHPHVLLLQQQIGKQNIYKLPGGRIKPGETEMDGLIRKLRSHLAPSNKGSDAKWEIGEEMATWWRPNFGEEQYPYLPVHVSRPKECKKIFLVRLPEHSTFAIAKNRNLVAVPLYELYDNHLHYGPIISAIPVILARHTCICSEPEKPPETEPPNPAQSDKPADKAEKGEKGEGGGEGGGDAADKGQVEGKGGKGEKGDETDKGDSGDTHADTGTASDKMEA